MAYVEYEADGKTIKARVWQKVDTLANWEANSLVIGPGEQAFVIDGAGTPINFKIGDGTKKFSELPWWISYDQGQYVQVVGNALPTPTVELGYSFVGPGTYTHAGGDVVAPEGRFSQIVFEGGSWSLKDMGALPTTPTSDVVAKNGTEATEQSAVWNYNKDLFNVAKIPAGESILQGIKANDLISNKALVASGLVVDSAGWNSLKLYIPIVEGVYTTNIYLTAATFLVTYDDDFNIINTYSNKGNSTGSSTWSFTTGSNEKYFRYCYSTTQAAPYITTDVDFIAILPSVILEPNLAFKNFLQGSDYDKIAKASERYKPFFGNITKSGFDARSIVDIKLIQGTVEQLKSAGVWKDLYLVYQRYMTLDGFASTIFQIGEKVGTDVGVNKNLIASFSGELAEDSNKRITLELNQANSSGLRFIVTVDTKYLRTLVDTSTDLAGTIQLNTRYFEAQALEIKQQAGVVAKGKSFLKPSFVDTFDYRSIVSVEPTIANPSDLEGLDLYITYMRFKGFDPVAITTSIVQISKLVSGVYTLLATCSIDKSPDADGMIELDLTPSNDSNLWFKVTIDTKYLKQGTDTTQNLTNKIRLNVPYLLSRSKDYNKSKKVVRVGDSTLEFNTGSQMSRNLGMRVVNGGIGGTTISQHYDAYYNELSFFKIAEAIASGNWTPVEAAAQWLKDNKGDDNTAIVARLKATNFATVDILTVGYGTNDFANGSNIGATTLGNVDTTTVAGALNYGIGVIQTAFPNIKVFVQTPTHRFFVNSGDATVYDSDVSPNTAGKYLIEYVDAIKTISALNHVPAVDMYRDGQFNKRNHSLYFADNVHPNALGYEMHDNMVANFIKSKLF